MIGTFARTNAWFCLRLSGGAKKSAIRLMLSAFSLFVTVTFCTIGAKISCIVCANTPIILWLLSSINCLKAIWFFVVRIGKYYTPLPFVYLLGFDYPQIQILIVVMFSMSKCPTLP